MKRMIAFLMVLIMVFTVVFSSMAEPVYRVKIDIDFIPNLIFSTYDVDLFLNDKELVVLTHGKDYSGSFEAKEGKNTLYFYKHEKKSPKGMIEIDVSSDIDVKCRISCYSGSIDVDNVSIIPVEAVTDPALTIATSNDSGQDNERDALRKKLDDEQDLTWFGDVRNDVTGKWRLSEYASADSQELIAADYYKAYFENDEEIHALINMITKKTARIAVMFGTILDVTILEYVPGEEHDAKELFGGKRLMEYWVHLDTGEIEKID